MSHREYSRFYHRIFFVFLTGFLVGILLIFWGQNRLINNTEFLGSESLRAVRSFQPDSIKLLGYSLKTRGIPAVFLVGMTIAGLGELSVFVYLIWYGFCAGSILSVFSLRYGIRGMILFVGGIMPQALFLIPAYILLIRWCVLTSGTVAGKDIRSVFKVLSQLVLPVILILTGCLLEACISPWILEKIFDSL